LNPLKVRASEGSALVLDNVTPLILTLDEEANIARVLDKLRWAKKVVVLDSGSIDGTAAVCAQHPNVRLVVRPFDQHAAQWNFGLKSTGIESDWVLALDADYVLTDAFIETLQRLQPPPDTAGYRARFRYCLFGEPLSGSLYPPVVVLFRRESARYVQDGHTQRLVLDGQAADLDGEILHDDRKPLSRWLAAQARYARLEAEWLSGKGWAELSWQDRTRKLVVLAPLFAPVYSLTFGKGIRDGRRGLYYAIQRGMAEAILSLELLQMRLER
jgi:glycosyltransferase involved in cell wall biosynthesis